MLDSLSVYIGIFTSIRYTVFVPVPSVSDEDIHVSRAQKHALTVLWLIQRVEIHHAATSERYPHNGFSVSMRKINLNLRSEVVSVERRRPNYVRAARCPGPVRTS